MDICVECLLLEQLLLASTHSTSVKYIVLRTAIVEHIFYFSSLFFWSQYCYNFVSPCTYKSLIHFVLEHREHKDIWHYTCYGYKQMISCQHDDQQAVDGGSQPKSLDSGKLLDV